ncbi:MAG: DUF4397 domain-containing protein [Candidatus Saccharibacteria bacterium]|nr:DUF4397 domain-containing protein [Microbacteriaceae bacterium]
MKKLTLRAIISTAALVAVVTIGTTATATATPALATPAAAPVATGSAGWLRVAHLSPDTKSVDVRVTALMGGASVYDLDSVKYGAVSSYRSMPAGVYTIAMVPAGSKSSAKPMLSASVAVVAGKAATVAAYGLNKKLTLKVFTDDLSTPAAGQARIRLIQASTRTSSIDVKTATGISIAENAKSGTATGYAEVAPGPWVLTLTGKNVRSIEPVTLANGSVTTLLVLDTTGGGLFVRPIVDSAAVGAAPVGGVQTGGGFLASAEDPIGTLPTVPTELR